MFRDLLRRLVPSSYRRSIKDAIGMPRWLHGNYSLLRRVGNLDQPHVVFDVGACHGWFTRCWLEYNPLAEVHCFEPSSSTFNSMLTPAVGVLAGVNLNNVAVGDKVGTVILNTGNFHPANSMLAVRPDSELSLEYSGQEEVRMIRLDNYIEQMNIQQIKVIKVDVQGYEMEVLRGLGDHLNSVDYLYIETSLHPVYDQSPTFCTALSYLDDWDFVVLDIKPNDLGTGYIRECDVLFGRKSDHAKQVKLDKII